MSKKHGTAFPFMVSVFVTLLPAASLRVSVTVSVPGLPEVSAPTPHRLPPTAGGEAADCGRSRGQDRLGVGCSCSDNAYNLSSDSTGGFIGTGRVQNTIPKLGLLASNGWPTRTLALL